MSGQIVPTRGPESPVLTPLATLLPGNFGNPFADILDSTVRFRPQPIDHEEQRVYHRESIRACDPIPSKTNGVPNGKWEIWFELPAKDGLRGKRPKRGGFISKAAAQDAIPMLREEIYQSLFTVELMQDALTKHLEYVADTYRQNTYDSYRFAFNHIPSSWHQKRIDQITPSDIKALLNTLRHKPFAAERLHASLSSLYNRLIRLEKLSKSPLKDITAPRVPKREYPILSDAQIDQILTESEGTRAHLPIVLALMVGLRRGEVCGLQWGDIESGWKRIRIRRQVTRAGIGPTKTESSRRPIPIPASLRYALVLHGQTVRETPSGWIFPRHSGDRPIWPESLNAITRPFLPTGVRFHDLRHNCATRLMELGTPPRVTQELLGHSNVAITLDVYSSVLPSMSAAAVDQLASLIEATRGDKVADTA